MPAEPQFDLTSFSLVDMTRCGARLRDLDAGARSLEELGQRLVRLLFDAFRDPHSGERQCALVRMFKTHAYGDLPPELRREAETKARSPLPAGRRCLTLLATAGVEAAWNSREHSVDHKVLPLPGREAMARLPMIARMLEQFGLEITTDDLLGSAGEPKTFDVFHVADALGSPYVPAQRAFVVPYGIRSVVAYGGLLPGGDLFAVILFARARVPAETAELFPLLALNTLAAFLHLDPAATFAARSASATHHRSFESRVHRELLRVQEQLVESQWTRLAAAEEERDRFFSLSLDMLCVAGMDGRFRRVNPTFSRTLGYTEDELLSQPFLELIHPDDRDATRAVMSKLAQGDDILHFHNRYRCKDGSYRWLSWSCPAPRGDSDALYAVARDITADKEKELRLREARAAAEDANREKDAFLTNMSHELRTPLNSMLGFTELALEAAVDPAQRDWLETAIESGRALVRIINDILDFSKMQTGKFGLDPLWFGLRETVEASVEALATQADAAGLELISHVRDDVPDQLRGDPVRLRQVLTNLLANAIKFTDTGEVELRVTVDERDQQNADLHFQVRDTGVGIPAAEQERIFAPFLQLDMSSSRRFGGTGLGLSICASLIAQMHGRIRVESEPGRGSVFHVTLPFAHRGGQPEQTDLSGLEVVVVDDNATSREVLREVLAAWRARPSSYASGADALRALRDSGRAPPLLIADATMPDIDGFELVRQVRERFGPTPAILLLTATALGQDTSRAAVLGAPWVGKPVQPARLLAAIRQALDGGAAPSTAVTDARSRTAPAKRRLRILLAEDSASNEALFVTLLERRGHSVAVARDGHEALRRARDGGFDLILMDIQLPGIDGLEVTRQLHAGACQDPLPPIIALTAHATPAERRACRAAGMKDTITKPIRIDTFYATIARVVAATPPSREASWTAALATVDGDRELLGRLIASAVTELPRRLAEMLAALRGDDFDALRRHAHTVRGTAAYFGANAAAERAQELQKAATARDRDRAQTALADLGPRLEELLHSFERWREEGRLQA